MLAGRPVCAILVLALLCGCAAGKNGEPPALVLADTAYLDKLGVEPVARDDDLQVGAVVADAKLKAKLTGLAWERGVCSAYDAVAIVSSPQDKAEAREKAREAIERLRRIEAENRGFEIARATSESRAVKVQPRSAIIQAVNAVQADRLSHDVKLLSETKWQNGRISSRRHDLADANKPGAAVKATIEDIIAGSPPRAAEIELIEHEYTPQRSVHVILPGASESSERAKEIVVLGAHIDSINIGDRHGDAPGANDNASGAAVLIEILRQAMSAPPAERTLEFFWYAGEEEGRIGSKEIAENYGKSNKPVVAVINFDMATHPGDGPGVIALEKRNTSAWLNVYVKDLISAYVPGVTQVLETNCGYACSDHSSWRNAGFSVVFPIEATRENRDRRIHSEQDVLDAHLSVDHAALFAQIGVAFALDLANPAGSGVSF
ncbi:MAG: M20/M25/M40 family metallo-hydrolase [Parvularculaceae bacterium]|nr:M20/M25/M40 family metallo-hydrolase [Parvularculaceae bacterium]